MIGSRATSSRRQPLVHPGEAQRVAAVVERRTGPRGRRSRDTGSARVVALEASWAAGTAVDAEAGELGGLAVGERDVGLGDAEPLGGELAVGRGDDELRARVATSSGRSVSASRWSVWLWLEVTTSTKASRSGAITRSVMRTCGLSVSAYFRGQRVGQVRVEQQVAPVALDQEAALAEPPQVQRPCASRPPRRRRGTRRRRARARSQPSSSRTFCTPAHHVRRASASRAQRAVWLRPQSGRERQPLGRRMLQAQAARASATSSGVSM